MKRWTTLAVLLAGCVQSDPDEFCRTVEEGRVRDESRAWFTLPPLADYPMTQDRTYAIEAVDVRTSETYAGTLSLERMGPVRGWLVEPALDHARQPRCDDYYEVPVEVSLVLDGGVGRHTSQWDLRVEEGSRGPYFTGDGAALVEPDAFETTLDTTSPELGHATGLHVIPRFVDDMLTYSLTLYYEDGFEPFLQVAVP